MVVTLVMQMVLMGADEGSDDSVGNAHAGDHNATDAASPNAAGGVYGAELVRHSG